MRFAKLCLLPDSKRFGATVKFFEESALDKFSANRAFGFDCRVREN